MAKATDLTGQKFTRLIVISRAANKNGRVMWDCLCDCGNTTATLANSLKRGGTKSCGCLGDEKRIERNTSHGLSGTPEHKTWDSMKQRCTNPNNIGFNIYGGRGITVCARWENFQNFIDDMGNKPTAAHSIERANNDRGYSPCNCYWADRVAQNNNKRNSRFITFNGKTQTLAQWSKETGIHYNTLFNRLNQGISMQDVFHQG